MTIPGGGRRGSRTRADTAGPPALRDRGWAEAAADAPAGWVEGLRRHGDALLLTVSALWIAALFSTWDVALWIGDAGARYGVYEVGQDALSNFASWLPLAEQVSRGNLLPVLPSVDADASGFSIYPYLTLWLHGLLVAVSGVRGTETIAHVVVPTACYVVFYRVLRLNLPRRWSIALAALALISFADVPLREFLRGLLEGYGWRELAPVQRPLVAHFPMPGLSLLAFLSVFYLSIRSRRLTLSWVSLLTVLWAVQSQVHPLNAVVGLAFWFATMPFRYRRQHAAAPARELAAVVAGQAAIAGALLVPALAAYLGFGEAASLDAESLGLVAGVTRGLPGAFYFFTYFALPLALLALAYPVVRIDAYELFFRFWPVFVMMAVELALVLLYGLFGIGVPVATTFARIGIFIHVLYYVPVLYYVARPGRAYHVGPESAPLAGMVRRGLAWCFNDASKVYLPLLLAALSLFALSGARASFLVQRDVTDPQLAAAWAQVEAARGPGGGTVVTELPVGNLLLPVATDHGTLWVNRFANRISLGESIERFALYARLLGWPEDRFVGMMTPGTLHRDTPGALVTLDQEGVVEAGLGYWFTAHNLDMADRDALARYQAMVRETYRTLDVPSAVERFDVRRVVAAGPLSPDAPVSSVTGTGAGFVYELGRAP